MLFCKVSNRLHQYRHVRRFFNQSSITSASILWTIHDKDEYFLFRRQLLVLTTKSEYAWATRIASQLDPSQIDSTIDPLVKIRISKRQQKHNSIIIPYDYERRFAHYKSKAHQFWNKTFLVTTGIDTKLIVGNRNNPSRTKELVRRSPLYLKRDQNQKNQTPFEPTKSDTFHIDRIAYIPFTLFLYPYGFIQSSFIFVCYFWLMKACVFPSLSPLILLFVVSTKNKI